MYKVQMNCLGTWEDCIHEDDGETRKLVLFATKEEAQKAIDELIADVKEAVEDGDMEDEYDPEDYRVIAAN